MKKLMIVILMGGLMTGLQALTDDFEDVDVNTPTDFHVKRVSDQFKRGVHHEVSGFKKEVQQEVEKQVAEMKKQVIAFVLAVVFKELPKMVANAVANAASGTYNKLKSGFNWLTGRSQPEEEVIIEQPVFQEDMFVRNY